MESVSALPATTQTFEIIDVSELAARLKLPVSWIREQCRSRTSDKIPHVAFGRYRRFEWNSPVLREWVNRHRTGNQGAAKKSGSRTV
jgi:hypothetical protein